MYITCLLLCLPSVIFILLVVQQERHPACKILSVMVPSGHGKSWNLGRPFSRPGKSWKIAKVKENDDNVMEFLLLH